MPKRQTNNLKWKADLLQLVEMTDPDTDRVIYDYPKIRDLKYNNIGVTATDRFMAKDVNEVSKKIECRIDRAVEANQKNYRVKIGERIYNIERVYVLEADRMMEVSLSYAD